MLIIMLTITPRMSVLPVGVFVIDIRLKNTSQRWVTLFSHPDMLRIGLLSGNWQISASVIELF